MLISELAKLMKYMAPEPRKTIVLDMDDMIQQRKLIEFGPDAKQEYVKVYKEKVEDRIKRLADEHPAIIKIKMDEALTEADLRALEETLNNPELYITEDVLQKVYNRSKGTLVQFVKNILGLYKFPEPETRIRDAFNTYIIENSRHYSADQLNFIRTVQTVSLGVVENVFPALQDKDEIIKHVGKRTVYSVYEIEKLAEKPTMVILFTWHFHLANPLKLSDLKEMNIFAPQSMALISHEKYLKIKSKGGIDERFTVH